MSIGKVKQEWRKHKELGQQESVKRMRQKVREFVEAERKQPSCSQNAHVVSAAANTTTRSRNQGVKDGMLNGASCSGGQIATDACAISALATATTTHANRSKERKQTEGNGGKDMQASLISPRTGRNPNPELNDDAVPPETFHFQYFHSPSNPTVSAGTFEREDYLLSPSLLVHPSAIHHNPTELCHSPGSLVIDYSLHEVEISPSLECNASSTIPVLEKEPDESKHDYPLEVGAQLVADTSSTPRAANKKKSSASTPTDSTSSASVSKLNRRRRRSVILAKAGSKPPPLPPMRNATRKIKATPSQVATPTAAPQPMLSFASPALATATTASSRPNDASSAAALPIPNSTNPAFNDNQHSTGTPQAATSSAEHVASTATDVDHRMSVSSTFSSSNPPGTPASTSMSIRTVTPDSKRVTLSESADFRARSAAKRRSRKKFRPAPPPPLSPPASPSRLTDPPSFSHNPKSSITSTAPPSPNMSSTTLSGHPQEAPCSRSSSPPSIAKMPSAHINSNFPAPVSTLVNHSPYLPHKPRIGVVSRSSGRPSLSSRTSLNSDIGSLSTVSTLSSAQSSSRRSSASSTGDEHSRSHSVPLSLFYNNIYVTSQKGHKPRRSFFEECLGNPAPLADPADLCSARMSGSMMNTSVSSISERRADPVPAFLLNTNIYIPEGITSSSSPRELELLSPGRKRKSPDVPVEVGPEVDTLPTRTVLTDVESPANPSEPEELTSMSPQGASSNKRPKKSAVVKPVKGVKLVKAKKVEIGLVALLEPREKENIDGNQSQLINAQTITDEVCPFSLFSRISLRRLYSLFANATTSTIALREHRS